MSKRTLSRRELLRTSGVLAAGAAATSFAGLWQSDGVAAQDLGDPFDKIKDPTIRAGVRAAVTKNLIPAATEKWYPGHFTISADGNAYGGDTTWPGLDSWQMAGAYLLIGKIRMVEDYFDFVRASQRKDGNIPFAIFDGDTRPGDTFLRGMKYPDDLFSYTPPKRDGLPSTSGETRKWIGLFRHWELKADPLSTLAPICYVLTAAEIFDANHSLPWLKERLASIESAANHLLTRISPNGLMSGSGFYIELPPRYGWDGVTQCYSVHAFRELARLMRAVGRKADSAAWAKHADGIAASFVREFWRKDHFGEYVHIERGLVDSHGLSDTNWAAIAFGVADDTHLRAVWPVLMKEKAFWQGNVPTQLVTKPFSYEEWENEPVPFAIPSAVNDVAAMGRVWYLEALACIRMHDNVRLRESAKLVAEVADDGYWRERYHPKPDGSVEPAGGEKYCEYPAILARIVLGNPGAFSR